MNLFKNLRGGALVGLGYMLSPLSWWNDLFFNLPIALVFGYGVSWVNPDWLFPGTLVGSKREISATCTAEFVVTEKAK